MARPFSHPPTRPSVRALLRPYAVLLLVCAGFSLHPQFFSTFWTREYLPNLLQQAATNIILAVGMTFVILTGGIDLSVGSVVALSGVTLGMTVTQGVPLFIGCLIALPLGVAAGCLVFVKYRAVALDVLLRLRSGQVSPPRAVALDVLSPPAPAGGVARVPNPLGSPGSREGEEKGVGVRFLRSDKLSHVARVIVCAVATLVIGWGITRITSGGLRLEWALLAAISLGVACGLINGGCITLGRVPPFVATLGMLTAARGLTLHATDGNSVSGLPERLGRLGEGRPLILIALAVVVAGTLLLTRTQTGRLITAIGGSEEACRLSGVPVHLYKALAYGLCGFTAAVAAIVLTAKFQLADTNAGVNAELNAIAAVVIGGTSLRGGEGSIVGSLVGALTIAVLNSGLVLIGVRDTLQGVVIGAVIVLTVMIDQMRKPT